jgi:membrane-bound lytic murein transglycosylase D
VGLWQLMPESARAYGLRVEDGKIDERLNPIKSTDAAIHFLTDLQRMLGSWDLALAAYNMGPYGVLARLHQVGGSAGFSDLTHAGLLPQETAGYVPAIEANALVLQNLVSLHFTAVGASMEQTAQIVVDPAQRLSLIARAAATNTLRIRDLNPEFLRDVVPEGCTSARVPNTEADRAQDFMSRWKSTDNWDTCVPENFDWGKTPFERSPYARCGQMVSPSP